MIERRSAAREVLSPRSSASDLPVEERPDALGMRDEFLELADHRPFQPGGGDVARWVQERT